MKTVICALVWGILLVQSSAVEGETSGQTAINFESFCTSFNDMRSNSNHIRNMMNALKGIRVELIKNGILPETYPLDVARDRCGDPTKAFDPECLYAFYYHITMANSFFIRVSQNEIRAIYVDIWLLHPFLRRCLPHLNKELRNIDGKFRLATGLAGANAAKFAEVLFGRNGKFLREEIENSCENKPVVDQPFCSSLLALVKLVNAFEKVKYEHQTGIKWNAYRLHFVMLKHNSPNEFQQVYPTTPEIVSDLIVKNLEAIFKYIGTGKIDQLTKQFMPLVPDLTTIKSGCETTWNLPANLKKSECMFWKTIIQVESFQQSKVALENGKVTKILNTNIDYPVFLALTEMDRILQVVQNQETALQDLTQWVTSELSKTINERFKGLRTYFQKVESFNREKANADIGYINGRLQKYKTTIVSLSTQLGRQIGTLIDYAIAAVSLELAEDTAQMALATAVLMNPLEKLFGGSSAGDLIDRTAKLAHTLTKVGEMIQRSRAFDDLVTESETIRTNFSTNAQFLENVRVLVDSIQKGTSTVDFETRKQDFLQQYTAYDPKVEKPTLAAMVTKWEDMIDGTCEVIMGSSTALAAVDVALVRSKGLCPNAKIKAAEMIATYEEVYDFQFELIETMATYMRAMTALDAASSISADYDDLSQQPADDANVLNDLKTLSLVSYITYKINMWEITEAYCNILEYKRGGVRPSVCRGLDTDIASLASYVSAACRNSGGGYKEVPITSDSDQAFMKFSDLYAGRRVTFKIPNGQWLVNNGWITAQDQDAVIVVKTFEVFLPTVSDTERTARIEAKVIGFNQHLPPDGASYVIARDPEKKFIFEYLEGHSAQCRKESDALTNPYGSSLPKICPLNVDENNCQELLEKTPLFPSVYSKWQVSVSGYESVKLPTPATAFKLKVGVKLCILERPTKDKIKKTNDRGKISRMLLDKHKNKNTNKTKNKNKKFRGAGLTSCPDGQYLPADTDSCAPCPEGSRSALNGYYCEKISKD